MLYHIYHWYKGYDEATMKALGAQLVPLQYIGDKGVQKIEDVWTIYLPDTSTSLHGFIINNKLRTAQLVAPTDSFPYWSIYITDGTRFGQR